MPRGTKFKPEEIISKLREAEVELARGKKIPEVCKQIGVTEQTYYRWKKEYGGLRMDQAQLQLNDWFTNRGQVRSARCLALQNLLLLRLNPAKAPPH